MDIRDSQILRNGQEAISGGSAGGGIYTAGVDQTRISDTLIQNNRAALGGGLYASSLAGSLRLTGVTIAENLAQHVRDRTGEFDHGEGGGLYIAAHDYAIADSLIIDNVAEEDGGGIYIASFGETIEDINHTAIARNTAEQGGGIYMRGGEVRIVNVTISSNQAALGSAIYNDVESGLALTLWYTTISNNGASSGDASLGDALYQEPGSSSWFSLSGSLLVGNLGPACFGVPGSFRTGGYNYVDSLACFYGDASTDLPSASLSLAALGLSPLTEDGGTLVHLLSPWSAAVDFISPAFCQADDQRHVLRPQGDLCDIGAYELNFEELSTGAAEVPLIPTPTGELPTAIITTDTLCLTGPGSNYLVINTLKAGLVADLIGAGETGQGNDDWLVLSHPNIPNASCWVEAKYTLPSIPFEQMRLIFVPAPPTATPQPTREPGAPPTSAPPTPTCDPQYQQNC